MLPVLCTLALAGAVHLHHAPSHDSEAPFEALLEAAFERRLDFLILTEHVPEGASGPLPATERAGLHTGPHGRETLVIVGGEFGSSDGHVLGLGIARAVPAGESVPARAVVAAIRAAGGFAVIPHPFAYGGFRAWDVEFTGVEVHNNAAAFRAALGPLLPFRLLRLAFDRDAVARALLGRPDRALRKLDELLAAGRDVVAFSGVDAHQNVRLLGRTLDPYDWLLGLVETRCPEGPLTAASLLADLRSGRCWIRYRIFDHRESEARRVVLPSGRVELQLDGGRRVLEIRNRGAGSSALSSAP